MTLTVVQVDRTGLAKGKGRGKMGHGLLYLAFENETYEVSPAGDDWGIDLTEALELLKLDQNHLVCSTVNQTISFNQYGEDEEDGWARVTPEESTGGIRHYLELIHFSAPGSGIVMVASGENYSGSAYIIYIHNWSQSGQVTTDRINALWS